jgi:hypothetical protein
MKTTAHIRLSEFGILKPANVPALGIVATDRHIYTVRGRGELERSALSNPQPG